MKEMIFQYLYRKAIQNPYFHLPGYMNRYWLVPFTNNRPGCGKVSFFKRPIARILQALGISIRLHHILRSDEGRVFHDHPWPFITILLKGSYTEIKPLFKSGMYFGESHETYFAGDVLFRRATDWHRLEVDQGTVWTLFICFKRQQDWGFLTTADYKTHYTEYVGTP